MKGPHRLGQASEDKPVGTVHPQTLARLEVVTGHRFTDLARLDRALTHASARSRTGRDYERLEFLGDRVLGLCIAELLFAEFPDADEGELSVRLNALVNAETLAAVAADTGIQTFIRLGADMRSVAGDRLRNINADVVESLIAAIYLEGGLPPAREFIRRQWEGRARHVAAGRRDAKTELQEWAHRTRAVQPVYRVVSREGPDHEPSFTVEVRVGSLDPEHAAGPSKRAAEQLAAARLLMREAVWQSDALETGAD